MQSKQVEALKLALKALRNHSGNYKLNEVESKNQIAVEDYLEQALAAPVQVDDEGENIAVRSFLMLYGQPGLTVGQMKKHMDMSGHSCCPVWVYTEPKGAHLTKSGAQLWIRHLFALESSPPAAQQQWVGLTLSDREKLRDQFEGWSYPAILVDAVSDILKEKNNV